MNYVMLVDPPSVEDSARRLQELACLKQREKVKARARLMRDEMGLKPLEALQ